MSSVPKSRRGWLKNRRTDRKEADIISDERRPAIPFETALRRWDADVIDAAQHEFELPESSEAFTLQPGEAVIFKGSGS